MENKNGKSVNQKSEILFLYESTYSIPNGDPFTGEQRYDEETKKVLVSDVRIKRYIRDYILELNDNLSEDNDKHEIYVWNDISQAEGKESGSAARVKSLRNKFGKDILANDLLKKCIDVRLFGGISTEKTQAINLTGPVQFALLNPSLNKVELRIHQNTSVFVSSMEKSRGAIGTTSVVPYCINQIHGWINPFSAKFTDLTNDDVALMFRAMWESINNINTRSKSNQNSILLLQIIYSDPTNKIYGLDRLIKPIPNNDMRNEQIRSLDDYEFDFTELKRVFGSEFVTKINYYSEIENIKKMIQELDSTGKKSNIMNFN